MTFGAMSLGLVRLSMLVAVGASTISTCNAIDATYVGTWSRSDVKCDFDETFRITKEGTIGHEFACKTRLSSRDKIGWTLRLSCSGEGETYTRNVRWRLLNSGRLQETEKGKTVEYERCSGITGPQKQPVIMDTPFGRVTREDFAMKCVECFNESQQIGRSVGGYCPANCAEVFDDMVCDNQGRCHARP